MGVCVAVYLHSLRLCSDQWRGCGKSPAHAPWSRRALRLDPAFPNQSDHAAPPPKHARISCKVREQHFIKSNIARGWTAGFISALPQDALGRARLDGNLCAGLISCTLQHHARRKHTIKRSNDHHRRQSTLPCMQIACQKDIWERE